MIEKIYFAFDKIRIFLEDFFCSHSNMSISASYKKRIDGEKEMVTNIDRKIEDFCIEYLAQVFPEIPVIAEEHFVEKTIIPEKGWCFIIDPIDGTHEFFQGSHEWSVSLCAVNDLSPIVGMIILPHLRMKFHACKNRGVYINNKIISTYNNYNMRKRIAVSPRQIQVEKFSVAVEKTNFEFIQIPTVTIKIVSILLGRVDAAVYFPQSGKIANIWDYAAAILLLQEFGGRMTSLNGSEMPFGSHDIVQRDGWLATNCLCDHDMLCQILNMKYL